eukprot:CAMPEP_0204284058 /NCGR_PEP_ID=MMETSP0468-20130131/47658_1 /ASSEMBLY_ACC=CAM_ASM_000383 /TAXON_ID=2969 /ORGANISM="Oxyrrhis marina" /LENGTH=98 /DNA_ID=CAMNT_0051261753 /DNA_START=359 /DNA_END=652 /DNA_ORIENTATION=-
MSRPITALLTFTNVFKHRWIARTLASTLPINPIAAANDWLILAASSESSSAPVSSRPAWSLEGHEHGDRIPRSSDAPMDPTCSPAATVTLFAQAAAVP